VRLPDLEGMTLFVKIVENGSLSATGRALAVPKATVSRRLSELEARLGVRLLNRSTRRLSLTDAGHAFHRRCAPIVAEAEAAESEVLATTGTPSGRVRVAAPLGLGQVLLMPLLTEFLKKYPAVSLDLDFADRRFDVIAEGFDIAFRLGALEDTSLIARRLFTYRRVLVASPDYVRGAPPLIVPEDLAAHAAVLISPSNQDLTLETGAGDVVVRVPWRIAVHNILLVRDAAAAGHGIALVPDYVVADDLASGRLVRVLASATAPEVEASLVYPQARNRSVAVSRLIDHCMEGLRGDGRALTA
jgi:DNA-binding transcriptional LysR family regulator